MWRSRLGQLAEKAVGRSTRGLATGAHLTRYTMYQRLAEVGAVLPSQVDRALSISHSANLLPILGVAAAEVVEANYPDFTMLDLPFEDETFDLVVSDQVLEHIEGDPFTAVAQTARLLRPGGVLVHTTCMINQIHASPSDFWRFTPEALALLCGDLDVIEAAGWGNRAAVACLSLMPVRLAPVPHARWHPLHKLATANKSTWPISTWVVARKPGGARSGA